MFATRPLVFALSVLAILLSLGPSLATSTATGSATTGSAFGTLEALSKGNERFRGATARRQEAVSRMVEEAPSFMFLGCTDNRLTPASIFQAPIGSIITQNNIGNQYSKKDISTDAAITYAVEDLGVKHIIVLGHYGCPGVKKAIAGSNANSPVIKWIKPIADFYKNARREEIVKFRDSRMPRRGLPEGIKTDPSNGDAGFRAVIEENVRKSVKALKHGSLLAKAYKRDAKTRMANTNLEVYVHGFVVDESTGVVNDLKVSFGPPGKPIPPVPFKAMEAAKNFHSKRDGGKFSKGKNL